MKRNNENIFVAVIFIVSFISSISFFIYSCNKQKEYIQNIETETITATKVDTIFVDTINKIDNPTPFINQDSLDRVELIKDSIAFRKSVKIINGGYNGFADRYAMWLRARKEIKKQKR